ncbi:BirA family biotin operon repressor/biotin-[acetyl-CoA-carboxylase] ligase [Peptoniphilus ivorii]|uniref:biotin--[acetyl-CoA-carboxylase] ligase n=1 Tax=Aedoeadaptatus ivorii TaxID=54006 RepID=UPI002780004E|nr:biotin--[acetyl-CoA-carboxylase] ligase [Peptoniphilus ivorii]MDQ0508145.1 BirA family biotin operon repressor/biotin-[acetyl-CoA-carboxylase] ligase [Peptoniphilus ivorii]
MANKDIILKKLKESEDFLSGEEIAESLHITRASVWQSVKALRDEGYRIVAVTNRGYFLDTDYAPLDADTIRSMRAPKDMAAEGIVLQTVDSTNDELFRRNKKTPLPSYSFVAAEEQTAGKGRVGKSFHSPFGTGLYLSVLLKDEVYVRPDLITITAAVAARRAAARQSDLPVEIKWVNDLYSAHKKIAGILTEADFSAPSRPVVVGIGINTATSQESFERKQLPRAGSLRGTAVDRNRLAADFLSELHACFLTDPRDILKEYRTHNLVLGRTVRFSEGDIVSTGVAESIDDNGHLIVRAGTRRVTLRAGEVSVEGDW